MMLSDIGNPHHRAVAYALRAMNIDVVGFSHGHNPGFVTNRAVPHGQQSPCSLYICPTWKTAEYHEELQDASNMQRKKDTQFSSIETTEYSDLYKRWKGKPVNFPYRSIMVIGSQLLPLRSMAGTGEFFIFKLDLELKLVEVLKQAGYHVIYKAHPQYLKQVQGVFEDRADEIETRPFEQVMDNADAFVFTHPLTTPFGLSLCTNKPITLIDVEERDWEPKGYKLLRRRCHMIPAKFSPSTNMVEFNENDLLEFLDSPPAEVNEDYLRMHMFPRQETNGSERGDSGLT
jgi:hypothetical protein